MEDSCKELRKGAWSAEEDSLLRQCIDKHGEGKCHQVPLRSGLNRCRKSCRLRWLNYLKPSIKKGKLGSDEVDLLLRLHKLLGNRWSLIAGRLPGRTANDVKNYWNTHLRKKHESCHETKMKKRNITSTSVQKIDVLKPRPRSFTVTNGCSHLNPLPNEFVNNHSCPGQKNHKAFDNGMARNTDEEVFELVNNQVMDKDNMWLERLLEESTEAEATSALDFDQLWSSLFDGVAMELD